MLDLTSFYLTSLIVGVSLGICYQGERIVGIEEDDGIHLLISGTEAFASRSFIRWLHHFLVLGAILSTALLLLLSPTDASTESRPRRDLCHRSFCCVSSIDSDAFICAENNETVSTDCSEVLSECGNVSASTCVLETKHLRCQVEMVCSNGSQPTCSNSSKHRNKPSNAISGQDDRRVNLLFSKMHTLYLSIRWIHVIYLVLALGFFLLATFYSVLAIRGEHAHLSTSVQLNPLALFVLQAPSKVHSSNEGSSWALVGLLVVFYFLLAGMESSLTYLSYLFALDRRFSERWSLLVQLLYLAGRLLDIVVDSGWLFFKLRSDYLSLKISILLRLVVLFLLCFLQLLYAFLPVSLLFLALGYLLNSISRLVLQWIVRDFHTDELVLRLIFVAFMFSESICPVSLFSQINRLVSVYFTGASAVLIVLLLIIVCRSQKWQSNRVYRLLSPSTEVEEEEEDNQL